MIIRLDCEKSRIELSSLSLSLSLSLREEKKKKKKKKKKRGKNQHEKLLCFFSSRLVFYVKRVPSLIFNSWKLSNCLFNLRFCNQTRDICDLSTPYFSRVCELVNSKAHYFLHTITLKALPFTLFLALPTCPCLTLLESSLV